MGKHESSLTKSYFGCVMKGLSKLGETLRDSVGIFYFVVFSDDGIID